MSPKTSWEAFVARSPEVIAATRTRSNCSHTELSAVGLQRALFRPSDTPGSCMFLVEGEEDIPLALSSLGADGDF